MFETASTLFLKKWSTINPDFVKYFHDQWISKNMNWYESAAPGKPSTNNGLEGTNAVIKAEHILKERLPEGQFLLCAMDVLETWSTKRNPTSINCVPFAHIHTSTSQEWTCAYQWASPNQKVLQQAHPQIGYRYYYTVSSTSIMDITNVTFNAFLAAELKWKTFDEYINDLVPVFGSL